MTGTQIPCGNDNLKVQRQSRSSAVACFARSASRPPPIRLRSGQAAELLGGQFFLFAFHAHLFELALFGFDGCGDFLLDLGCRFFKESACHRAKYPHRQSQELANVPSRVR